MITILATSQKNKKIKKIVPNHIGKIKTYNFIKIGNILCIENKIGKDLMN